MYRLELRCGVQRVDFLSQTVRLQDGGLRIEPPERKEVWSGASQFADGGNLLASAYGTRAITVHFTVAGNTRTAISDTLGQISYILHLAKQRSITRRGERAELLFQVDEGDPLYFEVTSGILRLPENLMSVEQVLQRDLNGMYVIYDVVLELTAQPFAYRISVNDTPPLLTLSNTAGMGTEVTVWNTGTGYSNYVEIAGADIRGALPARTVFTLTVDSGESEKVGTVFIGVRKMGNLSTFDPMLEDTSASYVLNGTPVQHTASSGGTYTPITYTVAQTNPPTPIQPVTLAKWSVDMASRQGIFRVFGKVKDGTFWDADCTFALFVTYENTVLYQTEWMSPLSNTTQLFDFGTLVLPPSVLNSQNVDNVTLELRAWRKLYGTTVVNLDYLMLFPQDGGYRVLKFRGVGAGLLEKIVDDTWNGEVFHVKTNGKRTGLPYALMRPVTLDPRQSQRVYFLWQGISGSCETSRRLKVNIGYVQSDLL